MNSVSIEIKLILPIKEKAHSQFGWLIVPINEDQSRETGETSRAAFRREVSKSNFSYSIDNNSRNIKDLHVPFHIVEHLWSYNELSPCHLYWNYVWLTSTASVPLSIRSIFVKTPMVLSPKNLKSINQELEHQQITAFKLFTSTKHFQ